MTLLSVGKALSSGSQWYFFSQKTQDRATKNGYWKQLDIDEAIYTSAGKKVGIKKYLLFYMGEAPEGIETNWIMQEYSLSNSGLGCTSYKRIAGKKILVSNFSTSTQYCYIILPMMLEVGTDHTFFFCLIVCFIRMVLNGFFVEFMKERVLNMVFGAMRTMMMEPSFHV